MKLIISRSVKLFLLLTVLLFTINAADAVIAPSDQEDYEVMAEGRNYVAYFSQFDTNGFTYEISGHSFSFLPRKLSYTDDGGNTTVELGTSHFSQIQNTTGMVYYDNPYGLENQLQYICNPLMVKEVYVMDSLPSPKNPDDWMTISSIAIFGDDLELHYLDENGEEVQWNGALAKTKEITFYDTSGNFVFNFPVPIAKDAENNTVSGHYLIHEEGGILYISLRFSHDSLVGMTLPIYLDLSLAEGKVDFGKSEYVIGETLDVWARGYSSSNERTLLYNPSGDLVVTWDYAHYSDGWTSEYNYDADATGTWKAELQKKPWLWGDWERVDTATTEVIAKPTPVPDPVPDPDPEDPDYPTQPENPVKGVLYGDIFSTTGEKLKHVNIEVDTGESDSTGSDNDYAMRASVGWHHVTASLDGYHSDTEYVYIKSGGSFTQLDFMLEPKVQSLPDLSISSSDIFFEKVV